jgi:hypothetical protein
MTKYSHLSQEQTYQVEALNKAGNSQTEFAQIAGGSEFPTKCNARVL